MRCVPFFQCSSVLAALITVTAPTAAAQCLRQTLIPADPTEHGFGLSLATAGPLLVVGSPYGDGAVGDSGLAYVYHFDGALWQEDQKLFAGDGAAKDGFGVAVAISPDGSWILVGADMASPQGITSGAAYLFSFDGQKWQEAQKLTPTGAEHLDRFGYRVAIDGTWAAVGMPWDDGACPTDPMCQSGSVELFGFDGTVWQSRQLLQPAGVARDDQFGTSLVLGPGRLVAGAPGDDQVAPMAGAAYVFDFDGVSWNEGQVLLPSAGDDEDQYGTSLAQEGNRLVVGAREAWPFLGDSGEAYVYLHDGQAFVEEAHLEPPSLQWDFYGYSVALAGSQLLVGAMQDQDAGMQAGAAYLYRHDGVAWRLHRKMWPPAGSKTINFSFGMAWSGRQALIGAPLPDYPGAGPGKVHVYDMPYLDLSVQPTDPMAGDTLLWSLDQGLPAGPLLVLVVGVNGFPTLVRVERSTFDGLGQWSRADLVPPGLACTRLTLLSMGTDACGDFELSDFAVVSFR